MATEKNTQVIVQNITSKEYDELHYMFINWFGFDSVSSKRDCDDYFEANHEGYSSDFEDGDGINLILYSVWKYLGRFEEITFFHYYPETRYDEYKVYYKDTYDKLSDLVDDELKNKFTLKDDQIRFFCAEEKDLYYITEKEFRYKLFNKDYDIYDFNIVVEFRGKEPSDFNARKKLISSNIESLPEEFKKEAKSLIKNLTKEFK